MKRFLVSLIVVLVAFTAHAAAPTTLTQTGAQVQAAISVAQAIGSKTIYITGTGTEATDKSAIDAALTSLAAGTGGTIVIVGTARYDSQLVMPNDAGIPQRQVPIRITGFSSDTHGFWGATTTTPPSALDFRYATGAVGKILTTGFGYLEIDHITLMDGGLLANTVPFIRAINTTLNVHDCTFKGSTATADSSNDGIVFGGALNTTGYTYNNPFQGYGTRIKNNFFDQMRKIMVLNVWANHLLIEGNTVSQTCSFSTGAPIEINGYDAAEPSTGNVFFGNLLEINGYAYGFKFSYASQNMFIGNGFYDNGAGFIAYYFDNASVKNTIITGYYTAGTVTLLGGVAGLLDQQMIVDATNPSIFVGTTAVNTLGSGSCTAQRRGLHLKLNGGAGYPDLELVCAKNADDTYTYKTALSSYLGAELVTNGIFGAGSWTGDAAGGWLIGGGVVTHTAGSTGDFYQGIGTTRYKAYQVSYDLTITAGTFRIEMMGYQGLARSAGGVGLKEIFVTNNTDANLYFTAPSAFAGTVDNVSVKEIIPY